MRIPPLRIAVTYNLRTKETEEQAERLHQDYIDDVQAALGSLGHDVQQVEVTGPPHEVFRRLHDAAPDLVFNLAEGEEGIWREAFYPMMYEFLGLPYTCSGPGILGLSLNKRLTEEALSQKGVRVPRGRLVTKERPEIPEGLHYPLLVKPNFEGSAMGIHQDSVVGTAEEAEALVARLLPDYPEGLDVEEFIEGRELTIGFLAEEEEDVLTKIVEYRFRRSGHNILDYETKMAGGAEDVVETLCPAPLTAREEAAIRDTAVRTFGAMRVRDACRIDLRMRNDGTVFLIEVNPLPGLRDVSPLVVGTRAQGLSYAETLGLIVQSAAKRYGLAGTPVRDLLSAEATA